jgi:hypothetical protein
MFNVFDPGPSEDDAHAAQQPGSIRVPAFIETEPGSFKPVEECSRSEIETKIMSLTMQAQALTDEADALDRYLDQREG